MIKKTIVKFYAHLYNIYKITMEKKYLDKNLPIEERVNDLLSKMTVDEKINQMFTTGMNEVNELLARTEKGEKLDISCTFVYFGFDVEAFNKLQRYQVENTRLGIPILLACENTHGVSNPLCTVYPTSGCLAATFDPELAYKEAQESGRESRVLGIRQVYAPNIDISWDQRWGRVEENYGEDPYLTSEIVKNVVKGLQENGVAATLKHYIAYGLGESGINLAPAHIGEREVREYMLPPFEAGVKAGAWSLMPSYNEVDGVPVHSSARLMKDVLRDELGFDGMNITDYGASNMMLGFHHIIDKPVEAGVILCDNEIDMEGCSYFGYNDEFRELVKSGKYPIEKVDKCVANILRLKFRAGLFENPYAMTDKLNELHTDKSVALAREIAEKGIVMLKNDGTLPLNKNKKVAVIGPNGNISQLGNYIYYGYFDSSYTGPCVAEESKSLYQVLKDGGLDVEFSIGCDFAKTDEDKLSAAEQVARNSDVVILALGDSSKGGKFGGNQEGLVAEDSIAVTSGEGYDLHYVELLKPQKELFERVAAIGKPIIMVLYGGRPKAVTEQLDRTNALFFAFGAGEQGNEALADILYGKVNPSGKLPITFPRSTGHLPCYYNHKPSARGSFYRRPGNENNPGKDYVFEDPKPLFPFGFGLSYTSYAYDNLSVEKDGNNYKVKVSVTNTGKIDGEESVLLFLSAKTQRVTPEVKKLRAFKRVKLSSGASAVVTFTLCDEDFTYVDVDMKKRVAYTDYTVFVGDKTAVFKVTE